ncbi:MAG: oligosaccharide flippase family protein [Sphingomonadales bacterium]|nr:oligosaccharide flippase family protein [Sphingomonadales bacterium]
MRRDFVTSAFGVGAGQFILFAATPLLTRAYSPQEFGIYAVSFAIAGVFATIAALRFDLALSSASSPDVRALLNFALWLPLVTVPALSLVLLGLQQIFTFAMPLDTFELIIATAATSIFQGMVLVTWAYCTRLGRFRTSAALRILQSASFVAAALFLFNSLVYSMLLSWGVTILAMLAILLREKSLSFHGGSLAQIKRYRQISVVSTPVTLLDSLTLAMPVIFIGIAFGDQSAGQYSQVQRLITAPLMLLAMSISPIFLKHGGEAFRSGKSILSIAKKIFIAIALLALLYSIVVYFTGEKIIYLFMGDIWRTETQFIILLFITNSFSILYFTIFWNISSRRKNFYWIILADCIFYIDGINYFVELQSTRNQ